MAWGRETNQDKLRQAISKMIAETIPGGKERAPGWIVDNGKLRFKFANHGESYMSKAGVRISVRVDDQHHIEDREPFVMVKDLEEAREKLVNKLLPAAEKLRERVAEVRKWRAEAADKLTKEGIEIVERLKRAGAEGTLSSGATLGRGNYYSIATDSGATILVLRNNYNQWEIKLEAPKVCSLDALVGKVVDLKEYLG